MMNTATFLASCVLFATAISLIALFADGWLRRYATARHAMHLSALVLILLSPALIALQRANHIGSRNHLAWLLPNETANSVDSEFLEPPTSSKPSLATGSDVIERSAEPMTTDGMQGQSQGTEQSADLQTASVNPISIQPTSSSTTPAKPGFLESFSWNQIIQVGRYMSPWAIAIACLGTVAMLARMGVGWVRLHQILRDSDPVSNPRLERMFADACDRVGIHASAVQLVLSDQIDMPIAARLFRSVVVLPRGLVESDSHSDLEQVMIHELAHVKRGDQWVVLLQHLTLAIHWWNPLVHRLNRCLAEAREEICDNHVLATCDAPSYCRTLLEITKRQSHQAVPVGAVGLFTSRWKLEQRVESLLNVSRIRCTKMTWKGRWLIAMGVLAAMVSASQLTIPAKAVEPPVVVGEAPADDASNKGAAIPATKQRDNEAGVPTTMMPVSGSVKDDSGSPIAGAKLVAWCRNFDQIVEPKFVAITDADGRFQFSALPIRHPELQRFSITVHADGYAFQSKNTIRSYGLPPLNAITFDPNFVLRPSATGVVKVLDQKGAPVAGVQLKQLHRDGDLSVVTWIDGDDWGRLGLAIPTSDMEGKLEIPGIDPDAVFDLHLAHPDYAQTPVWNTSLSDAPLTAVIEKGDPVKFIVTSPSDPDLIDKAKIDVVVNDTGGHALLVFEVGKDGIVETRLRDVNSDIHIEHPTLVSRSWYFYESDRPTMEFSLYRTSPIKGRVVDATTGKGIEMAAVQFVANRRVLKQSWTDAKGDFECLVAEGFYTVQVGDNRKQWKFAENDQQVIEVVAGESITLDDFIVETTPPVRGRVTLESGEPVANAIVIRNFRETPVFTDADGRFDTLRPKRGLARIHAIHPTKKLSRIAVLPEDADAIELQVAPEGSVEGIFFDSNGNSLLGIPAALDIGISSDMNGTSVSTVLKTKLTGNLGIVRFDGLSEGAGYRLVARGRPTSDPKLRNDQSSPRYRLADMPTQPIELIIPPELEADLKQQGEYDQTAEMIQTLGDATWLQGQPIDIVTAEADFRLVVFGLSPSHFEQARLVRQLYVDSGVLIVGVHSKAFLLKEGSDLSDADLRFPVVIDDDVAKIRSRYGVDSNPVALLYDRDGRLIEKIERSTNLLWIMRNHILYDAR